MSNDLPTTYDSDMADDGSNPGEIPAFDDLPEKEQDAAKDKLAESFKDDIWEVAEHAELLLSLWAFAESGMYTAEQLQKQAKRCAPHPLRCLNAQWDAIKLDACREHIDEHETPDEDAGGDR